MDNFEFIEVIKMAANASDHSKQTIIKSFLSLARSSTLDFYDALLSKMNWAYFSGFVVNANISIVKDTIRFIYCFR